MQGYINSFESFGTKDGPGIRFVVFMQGCPLRCLYCQDYSVVVRESSVYQLCHYLCSLLRADQHDY